MPALYNTSDPFYELHGGGRLSVAQIRMAMRLVARHLNARYGRVPAKLFIGDHADPSRKPGRFLGETALGFYRGIESFAPGKPVLIGEYENPVHGVGVHDRAILLTIETFDSER